LDDAQLGEQLARRAAGTASGSELARAIEQRTASASQVRSRPWDAWVPNPPSSRRSIALPALSAALGLAVLLGTAGLLRQDAGEPPSSPISTTASTWLLSLQQLEQALGEVQSGTANLGAVVVANVAIEKVYFGFGLASQGNEQPSVRQACMVEFAPGVSDPYNGQCPFHYVIQGSDPPITVAGVPDTVPCAAGRCAIGETPGPFALGLHVGHVVQYISPVRLHDGAAVPWSVDEFIDSTSTEPMVVDGWLSGIAPLPCPAQDPAQANDFECGPASWITAAPFDPTVTPGPSADGFGFQGPIRGIRVENGAASMLGAGGLLPAGGAAIPAPRRGLYLVNRLPIDPAQCFLCSSATAFVAAEIKPLEVTTTGPHPDATSVDSPEASADSAWLMDEARLAGAVRAASETGGAGRVLIADVAFERAGDCAAEPIDLTTCYVVVSGSNPPIRVRDITGNCTGPFFCPVEIPPVVPADPGPYALRILDDGTVSFVGYVDRPARAADDPSPAWGFDDLRTHLGQLTGSTLGDYQLFVVDAWISGAGGEPRCLMVLRPYPQYGCGQATWLTAGPVEPNAYSTNGWSLTAPASSIRLPNGALPLGMEGRLVVGDAQSTRGTFLVRAVLPQPTLCFGCDGPAAELVAWLDPPQGLVAEEPSSARPPTPTAGASLTAEAAYALAYAQKFEESRATGDFAEAWLLLGPATKAIFGSIDAFRQAETAYNASGGTNYEIADPTQDPGVLNAADIGDAWSDFVPSTAWYISVNHPDIAGASAAAEGLVVASGVDGNWHVWVVH
jgi:hypothetical protein